jgi:hypothetical protein
LGGCARRRCQLLDFPVGQAIWARTKGSFPAQFSAEIDRELGAGERNATERAFLEVLANVRALPSPEPVPAPSAAQP